LFLRTVPDDTGEEVPDDGYERAANPEDEFTMPPRGGPDKQQ
jgi:hypothetical protein